MPGMLGNVPTMKRSSSSRSIAAILTWCAIRISRGLILVAATASCGVSTAAVESNEPSTAQDPEPYRPSPSGEVEAGVPTAASVAIPIAGNEAVAVAFLEAVRSGDRRALSRLLADPVHVAGSSHSRRSAIDRIVASRGVAVRIPPVDELVNERSIRSSRLDQGRRRRGNQTWLRSDDVVITIPLRRPGRLFFRQVLTPRWGAPRGVLWIRPGAPQPVQGF